VLSALVVKATIYLLVRLWLEVMPSGKDILGVALAVLGSAAIFWGSVQALRQTELKLLVAYSTVAQVGYLFLPFAIRSAELAVVAWRGALYFLLCHALAKAAMFMAVGNIARLGGSGRLSELHHTAQRFPVTLGAFGVAGVAIIGLPPSGGFLAKWMLLEASLGDRQWWLTIVILGGGLLSAGYVFKVVGLAFTEEGIASTSVGKSQPVEWIALLVALATLVLGFVAPSVLSLLEIGAPFGNVGAHQLPGEKSP
jgi:formate hydrogenlyase subunit 3/multisubunit Na+/H+ antiporter MnhD subunit